jgi:hypothetical protein
MTITTAPAVVLRNSLISAGLGVLPSAGGSWPVYVSNLPDSPRDSLCVYDTASSADGRYQTTGETITHPGFQIRIRSASYADGWAKAAAVCNHLDTVANESLSGNTLAAVTRQGEPLSLGVEPDSQGNQRFYGFTINGTLTLG